MRTIERRRQDPDALLRAIEAEETPQPGHLKIFFGYAAGVGKTYSMLKAAHAAKRRGIDVVAGYIEPHARPKTAALVNGLEVLPSRTCSEGGISVREFDVDAALARAPQLILVDELAHTNAAGCRHAKRYQDIEELLRAGIDVYTTVNVQHIESLNDMVAAVTGIVVRERIPDAVFDRASQVELVDIEPQDLLERLREGAVYRADQAERAAENFFTVENLTALREIALRRCADRMNLLTESARIRTQGDYHTGEHILVCLSSAPSNPRIIRTGARMAQAFRGTLTALYVKTPGDDDMTEENQKRLRDNIRLAEQLGAHIETIAGDDVATQIAEFARLSGVSKIVLGRSGVTRRRPWDKPTLTERLTALAPSLDIYIIPDSTLPKGYRPPRKKEGWRVSGRDMTWMVGILLAVTLLGLALFGAGVPETAIVAIYILGVMVISVLTDGWIPGILAAAIGVLAFNFFFTEPRFTFAAYGKDYPVIFGVMFLVSLVAGTLAARLKGNARRSAEVAYRTRLLFETNQLLQKDKTADAIIEHTAGQLKKLLKRSVVVYVGGPSTLSGPRLFPAEEAEPADCEELVTENEIAVAHWTAANNKRAGASTNTLAGARCLYLAIRAGETVYGVLGIDGADGPLEPFEYSVTLSMLGECALALESIRNAAEKEQAALLAQGEQLRANLLRSISHDLRTPLTSISGNASNLLANGDRLDAEMKTRIYTDIYDDSMWLINLVENLLSVTRIEEGRMRLRMTTELVDEVITEALSHCNRRKSEYRIRVTHADDLLLAKMDARLVMQVIINIVDNAIKYTPEGSTISIMTRPVGGMAEIRIADDGPGIPDDQKPRVFDMFYIGRAKIVDSRRSLGLGLSLCKSIINAHGGTILVSDNVPRGAVFTFTLPLGGTPDE